MKCLSTNQIEDIASVITSQYADNNDDNCPDIYEAVVQYIADMNTDFLEQFKNE